MCCIKMVKEKREINTRVAGLNNLPYFPWISAIVVSAKGSGQHFCCCWTHVNISTSGCGFIMSALRLNQCCCCFFSSNGCLGVPPPPLPSLVFTSTASCGPSSSDHSSWGGPTHPFSHEPQHRHTVHRHGEIPLRREIENGKSKKGGM